MRRGLGGKMYDALTGLAVSHGHYGWLENLTYLDFLIVYRMPEKIVDDSLLGIRSFDHLGLHPPVGDNGRVQGLESILLTPTFPYPPPKQGPKMSCGLA